MRDGLPEVDFIFEHFLLFTNIAHLSRRLPGTRYQSSRTRLNKGPENYKWFIQKKKENIPWETKQK